MLLFIYFHDMQDMINRSITNWYMLGSDITLWAIILFSFAAKIIQGMSPMVCEHSFDNQTDTLCQHTYMITLLT